MNRIDATKYLRQMKYLPDIIPLSNILLIITITLWIPLLTIYDSFGQPSFAKTPEIKYAHYEPSYAARVLIKKTGKIYIGREVEDLSKMQDLIADKMDELQSKKVQVFADAEVSWGKIIDVLQASKKAGVKVVGFMMEGEYSVLHYWETKNRYHEKGLKYPAVDR